MAGSLFQFDVDNDSPKIAYFPFVNLEPSQNVTDGWQLLYTGSGAATSPGQVGVGASYHYTSLNGASFLITWNGTGIDLVGNVSNVLFNITLDGIRNTSYSSDPANTILASFNDLNNTNHSLLLTTIITDPSSPDAYLTFDKARITYSPPQGFLNATHTSQAISDSNVAFMGSWNYVTDGTGNSMHVSRSAGDRAQTMFLGSAITIYGLTSSYSGSFSVTLDNVTTTLSAQSSYNNSDTLLFYATELPQDTPHQLTVTNLEDRTLALRMGGMNVTLFGNGIISPTSLSGSSSTPAGTIAAIVLAVVLLLVIGGILWYAWYRRWKNRVADRRAPSQSGERGTVEKPGSDIERVIDISPPPGEEELEIASLSTSKGYGFGLGLRRGFPFTYRKGKLGSSSSGISRNGSGPRTESHPMTPQHGRDEKRFSADTLTGDLPIFHGPPESEKLAPGWSNPVARMSLSFKHRNCEEQHGISLPGLHRPADSVDDNCEDDADVKTLTSRQNEALAATLCLSPRTSEAPTGIDATLRQHPDTHDEPRDPHPTPQFLQVRDTSPFRVDVSAILGSLKSGRDSRRTSGSGSSTWSKVRAKLYRRAHRDDHRRSCPADGNETSSSGPESVPVVLLESGSARPPSETAPASGTYSFLDFTSSHPSLRRHSKTTSLSSTPAEAGHGARETLPSSEGVSIRMMRIERSPDDMLATKPDAPSTASGGSHTETPSNNSGSPTHPSPDAPTTHTNGSSPFPFPITITTSTYLPHPYNYDPERPATPSPSPTGNPQPHLLQVPPRSPNEASSPTESVPFSVSDIHFRHSYSDYAGLDSRRESQASALPPHPPLPHHDSSQLSTPAFSPPPPYVVQRVLGLPTSPFSPTSPPAAPDTPTSTVTHESIHVRPGTAPSRISSLLGPRPRPRPSTAGSYRGTAAPQLPMQGGRSSLRTPR